MIAAVPQPSQSISLEDWLKKPIDRTKWAASQVIQAGDTNAKHGRTQARLWQVIGVTTCWPVI